MVMDLVLERKIFVLIPHQIRFLNGKLVLNFEIINKIFLHNDQNLNGGSNKEYKPQNQYLKVIFCFSVHLLLIQCLYPKRT